MKSTKTMLSMVTQAPYSRNELLAKRDAVTCGDLRGQYSNIEAPVCTGATSICTFSGSLQGCCDSQGSCQFYTTCNGPYAPSTCIDTQCLACPQSAPYCIKYQFWNDQLQQGFDGYSCAIFQDTQTVYGIATAVGQDASTTSEPSHSSTGESGHASGSNSLPANPTLTAAPISTSKSSSHTGAIVGGVIGGIAGLILLVALYFVYQRFFGNRTRRQGSLIRDTGPEIQQNWGDRDAPTNPFINNPHPA